MITTRVSIDAALPAIRLLPELVSLARAVSSMGMCDACCLRCARCEATAEARRLLDLIGEEPARSPAEREQVRERLFKVCGVTHLEGLE